VGINSFENKLFGFLSGKDTVSKDKWYTMESVYFETGKDILKPESQLQLENLSAILKAFPTATIKMGGYTDNSGDSLQNISLSTQRAKAAMAALLKLGVPANSVAAEGYGQNHPICVANDTKECMARNRRVDVRVTKK
jgi:outer membrane protein OmpA-like peptidoglycan-associated protein